ncbi:MAG: RtcB family protein [Castellaniella sp.]
MELAQGVKGWTQGVPVDDKALRQLRNMASLPILAGHVAVMPDVHLGKGATVGSVIATNAAIIPAAVGVDIGCGMVATQTSLTASDLPDSLAMLRSDLEAVIPVGFAAHDALVDTQGEGAAGKLLHKRALELSARFDKLAILEHAGRLNVSRMWAQLGTLGGGNHFVELCLDEHQNIWIMLHSGSRNVGKVFADIATNMAKERAMTLGHGIWPGSMKAHQSSICIRRRWPGHRTTPRIIAI